MSGQYSILFSNNSAQLKLTETTEGQHSGSQLMRFWYSSHRRPAKAQASLCIRVVSPEPFAVNTGSMEVDEWSDQISDIHPHRTAAHACLKNEFTEDEKYHNLISWLKENTFPRIYTINKRRGITGTIEPRHEKNLFMPHANNKGADQPAHRCSLISTFVVRCLDSLISLISISEISGL